jgi:branched-subunit amino acid permease
MFRTVGITLLAAVFLVAGLAGIGAAWAAWPRTPATSPLMALVALTWGCTYLVTAVLTWRRSPFAAPVFVVAIGLLLFPARLLVPGGQLLMPALVVLTLVACFGHWYLRRASKAAA